MRPKRARHVVLASLIFTLGLSLAAPSAGQAQKPQPTAQAKTTARGLLDRGREQFAAKDFEGALKSFKAAHEIMGVPTTGIELARTQLELGQLVEAQETALDVIRFGNAAGNPVYERSQAEAQKIEESLGKRIPSLVINVSGPLSTDDIQVTLDGSAIPSATLSLPLKVNPGKHLVDASAKGFERQSRKAEAAEGETKYIQILLSPAAGAQRPAGKEVDEAEAVTLDDRLAATPRWTWFVGGMGVLAAGASIGFASDFSIAQQTVARDCPNNDCTKSGYSDEQATELQARWNRSLTLSVVLGVAGAACIGAAIYGFASAKPKPTEVTLVPWFEKNGSGLVMTGRF
jgi:hypothetical protein